MKKTILILSSALLLSSFLGSCSKEEIKPNKDDSESIRTFNPNNSDDYNNNKAGFIDRVIISDTIIGITDPNSDEDEERRANKKKED